MQGNIGDCAVLEIGRPTDQAAHRDGGHTAEGALRRGLMKTAMSQLQMSARGFHRVLKLARTIADLAGSDTIKVTHLAEALQYRPRRQEL